jgi:Integrase core domain
MLQDRLGISERRRVPLRRAAALDAAAPSRLWLRSRVRDELLSVQVFTRLAEAKVMIEDFRHDSNRCRPHRAYRMMTPRRVQGRLGDRPPSLGRQRRTPPPLRDGSVRRRRTPTLQKPATHQLSRQVDP